MALFGKKNCDVCNAKIGLMGNRKLEDGNLCKDCAKKLSPFFSDRKKSTVEDIKGQLYYREENEREVANFSPTKTLGMGTKLMLNEFSRKFIVSSSRKWKEENPDVIDFGQVTGTYLEVGEEEKELKRKDIDGKEVSYSPRRFIYMFDFWMTLYVNHPYFDEIKFKINAGTIEIEPDRKISLGLDDGRASFAKTVGGFLMQAGADMTGSNAEYRQCEEIAEEIKSIFSQNNRSETGFTNEDRTEDVVQTEPPSAAAKCPQCGALTYPNAEGNCEFCGGKMKI